MSKTTFEPIGGNILIKVKDMDGDKLINGIIIPGITRDKSNLATIVKLGTGKIEDNKIIPFNVKENDTIMFDKFAGREIELENEKYLIIIEEDIIGIIKESE